MGKVMTDDMALLREYARHNSEDAFAALVSRHVNLVYSVALRDVRDPHLAEEITQAVFIILARKAEALDSKVILSGWLCRTARYTSANALTIQRRRQQREQEAYMQSILNEPEPDAWTQIAPLLGGAMEQLGQKDHDAVVLRFFEGKSFQEIGTAFGASENAAKKRVAYALEKLRKYFHKRGVVLPAAVITAAISANSVQAAPAVLAQTATAVAIAKGAMVPGSTLTLIQGALRIMAWSKTKTAVVVGVAALFAASMTTGVIKYERAVHLERVQGSWEGTVPARFQGRQRMVLRIFKADGSYHASIDEIDNGEKNIPATKFDVGGSSVFFASGSAFSFRGNLDSGATEISGRWNWTGVKASQPVTLKRTATPDVVQEPLAEVDYAPRQGSDLQGFWKGTLQVGNRPLRLHLKVAEASDGTFHAEVNSIDQPPIMPLPVTILDYNKPDVKISLQGIGATFTGRFDGETINGNWTQGGVTPLRFERANQKEEERALEAGKNYEHASEAELQGHWAGKLPGDYGLHLHLIFNIAQLSDGSFSATLDSPDQLLFAMPFDVITFTPQKVRLEMTNAGCFYEGKLSGGKLSGTWNFKPAGKRELLALERNKSS